MGETDIPDTLIDKGLALVKPTARVPLIVVLCCAGISLLLGGAGWSLSAEHSTQSNRLDLLEHRADALEISARQTVTDQSQTVHKLDIIDGKLDTIRQELEDRLPPRK